MDNIARITAHDLKDMVTHWLGCPPGGYLGSDYGSDIKALLHTPMAAGLADGLIDKCRQDVPLLSKAATGAVNVYAYDDPTAIDRKVIVFDVAGELINVSGASA